MKKQLLAIFASAALLTGTVSIPAYATTPTTVTIEQIATKKPGDSVTIQGTSTYANVLVKVIQPDNTILYFDDLPVTNNAFSQTFTLPENAAVGTYKIVVGQGTDVQTSTFSVVPSNSGGGGGGDTGGGNTGGGGGNTGGGGDTGGGNTGGTEDTTVSKVIEQGQLKVSVKASSQTTGNTVKGTITDADLQAALQSASNSAVAVHIPLSVANNQQGVVSLTAAQIGILSGLNASSTVVVSTGNSSVAVPVSVLKKAPQGTSVNISISHAADQSSLFSTLAGATVIDTPVSFDVNVVGESDAVPIDVDSTDFVKRAFVINEKVESFATGALFVEDGKVRPVPATFSSNPDGTTTVTINRPGFSAYAAATHNVSFSDIGASYANSRIQTLANKFLVYGTSATTFSPTQNVTRAEFAAMLVRALGLNAKEVAPFQDVQATDWFASDVAAVYEAGLVKGVGDGKFDPNAEITREDLTVMLAKALNMLKVTKSNPSKVTYADGASFASYAKDSIATVTESGLMTGESVNGTYFFHPKDSTTREAAATVLYFLLQNANLIN